MHGSYTSRNSFFSYIANRRDRRSCFCCSSIKSRQNKQIWVNYAVYENKKICTAHEIPVAIGSEKATALPVFHVFTGCDTVSSFKTIGKQTAWEKNNLFNEITEAFLTLSRRLEDIDEEARCPLEWFVNLLCDKASPQASICYARNSSHEDVLLKRFPQLWQHYSSMTKEQPTREVIVGAK